jgi:hypothetical protein
VYTCGVNAIYHRKQQEVTEYRLLLYRCGGERKEEEEANDL